MYLMSRDFDHFDYSSTCMDKSARSGNFVVSDKVN